MTATDDPGVKRESLRHTQLRCIAARIDFWLKDSIFILIQVTLSVSFRCLYAFCNCRGN